QCDAARPCHSPDGSLQLAVGYVNDTNAFAVEACDVRSLAVFADGYSKRSTSHLETTSRLVRRQVHDRDARVRWLRVCDDSPGCGVYGRCQTEACGEYGTRDLP